ncbi:hypothetical protein NPX13_g7478 [Xylaria arbuscula]|uniref:Uncharacterized protein n=1 Tax=Xylaria arbuscula TaxID=114810 RepID=A0A9W8N9X0_9PEZI|nr:hypothetical protein NPX13_g7478 [Xylaria arbuscula]
MLRTRAILLPAFGRRPVILGLPKHPSKYFPHFVTNAPRNREPEKPEDSDTKSGNKTSQASSETPRDPEYEATRSEYESQVVGYYGPLYRPSDEKLEKDPILAQRFWAETYAKLVEKERQVLALQGENRCLQMDLRREKSRYEAVRMNLDNLSKLSDKIGGENAALRADIKRALEFAESFYRRFYV